MGSKNRTPTVVLGVVGDLWENGHVSQGQFTKFYGAILLHFAQNT